MKDLAQLLLAALDQLVAGLEDNRKQCAAECRKVVFDTDAPTPLTNGLINVAREFLERGDIDRAKQVMPKLLPAAELEWELIALEARLQDLKDDQQQEGE